VSPPSQALSDEHLAQRARAGDEAAFEALVQRFEGRVYRFALHCCPQEADAREVTQDTFVSAYFHLQRFDPARSFTTWLFAIARRKCVDRLRRAQPPAEEALPELADADDPSVLLARREAGQSLWAIARRALRPAQFQALWLRYAEELSVRDIARVLGKTRPHVKVLLFRGRSLLGRELRRLAQADGGGQASAPAPRPGRQKVPVSDLASSIAPRNL